MHAVIQLLHDRPQLTVVTATNRLSRRLLHEYNQQQLSRGLSAWPTPDILSWSAWIQRQWQQVTLQDDSAPVSLSTSQSLHLWQEIIEADSSELINPQATAQKAQAARQQIIDHALDLQDENIRQWFVYDVDASQWLDWHQRYLLRLQDHQWLDLPAIMQMIIQSIIDDVQPVDRPVCLAGFDALTPLQLQLQQWLIEHDYWIDAAQDQARSDGHAVLLPADDPSAELLHAAYWARQQFEHQWQEGDSPIGIIVPRLEQNRLQIERVFRQVFYPEDGLHTLYEQSLHTQGNREDSVFNISLGYSLKQEPVIGSALRVLALCRRTFSYEDFSQVLRSPFIINAHEQRSARSLLDNQLRQKLSAEISLNGLIAGMPTEPVHEFQVLLQQLASLKQAWPGKASAQTWTDCFQQCLSLFGVFESDGNFQTSYQYQVMQSLDEIWFEFSRLDLVNNTMSLEQAITTLTRMINSKIFQSGAGELPVQVLGVLEAAGLEFSSLWVVGMTEQNWPPPASPNPFIPLRLQRQYAMPHCSPQHEYEYARQQTARMMQAARNLVFSYPRMHGEEEFVPSPLLAGLPLMQASRLSDVLIPSPVMESIRDGQGPPIDFDSYHAGSGALKDQSQCPFRSFVVHRLKSRPPEEPQPGNDPRLRGQLVHKIMELLWLQWKTSDQLRALSEEQLSTTVRETIEQVLHDRWPGGNRDYEAMRLFNLITQWLQLEKQRQPFEVMSTEQRITRAINGLKLKLIIDRIDRLADGSLCVVDYKTGEASISNWLGERPDEPQLPLYALVQDEAVGAVAFGSIRAGESNYVGVTRDQALIGMDEKALSGVKQIPVTSGASSFKRYESWDGMLEEWQETIQRLADSHVRGDASVDPKDVNKTCRYCEVLSVCRLFEGLPEDEDAG